jgi:hypothetical protein
MLKFGYAKARHAAIFPHCFYRGILRRGDR